MDWLTFIASIIKYLAWPAVVVALIIVLRKELKELARRLHSVSFPGGAADFGQELDSAREDGEKAKLTAEARVQKMPKEIAPRPGRRPLYKLAEQYPEAALAFLVDDAHRRLFDRDV